MQIEMLPQSVALEDGGNQSEEPSAPCFCLTPTRSLSSSFILAYCTINIVLSRLSSSGCALMMVRSMLIPREKAASAPLAILKSSVDFEGLHKIIINTHTLRMTHYHHLSLR